MNLQWVEAKKKKIRSENLILIDPLMVYVNTLCNHFNGKTLTTFISLIYSEGTWRI